MRPERTQRVIDIQSTTPYSLSLQKQPSGHWHDASGQPIAGLQQCTDVDISITPFTNTLAINRLKLAPAGSEIINVLYIDLEMRGIKPVQQQYTHLGPGHYRYTSMDSGYYRRDPARFTKTSFWIIRISGNDCIHRLNALTKMN